MPTVDSWTTLIFMTVLLIFQSGAWLGVDRLFPRFPGVRLWAMASLIGGLGGLTLCVGEFISADNAITVGNLLQILGFLVAWNGIRRFFERKPLWWTCVLVMALCAGILVFSRLASHFEDTRIIVIAGTEALIALVCVHEMLKRPSALHMTTAASAFAMFAQAAALVTGALIMVLAMKPHSPASWYWKTACC